MPTPIIDAIFEVYSQTREYAELTQTKAIARAEADVLRKMPDPFEDEPLVTALIALVERRIFVLGFQHALRLMFEAQTPERSPA